MGKTRLVARCSKKKNVWRHRKAYSEALGTTYGDKEEIESRVHWADSLFCVLPHPLRHKTDCALRRTMQQPWEQQ